MIVPCSHLGSDIKPEQHNIAFLHDILLAFGTDQSFFPGNRVAAARHQVVEADNFGTYEAALDIGMDFAGCLGRPGTAPDCPGPDFRRAGSQEGHQSEQFITGVDDFI